MERKTRDGGVRNRLIHNRSKERRNGKNVKYRIQVRGRRWTIY